MTIRFKTTNYILNNKLTRLIECDNICEFVAVRHSNLTTQRVQNQHLKLYACGSWLKFKETLTRKSFEII